MTLPKVLMLTVPPEWEKEAEKPYWIAWVRAALFDECSRQPSPQDREFCDSARLIDLEAMRKTADIKPGFSRLAIIGALAEEVGYNAALREIAGEDER